MGIRTRSDAHQISFSCPSDSTIYPKLFAFHIPPSLLISRHFSTHRRHETVTRRICRRLQTRCVIVVGYASSATVEGNKAVGANFAKVDGSATKLSDLKVIGYEDVFETEMEGEFTGLVIASKLNEYGSTVKDESTGKDIKWTWADWVEEEERFTGWIDSKGNFVGDQIDIGLGEGLWIQSDDPKWQIQCAGQVYDQAVPCQLVEGNRFCANPCPAQIKLETCVVTGYEDVFETEMEGEFTGLVIASKLNEYGSTVKDVSTGKDIKWTWADWVEEEERFTGWIDSKGNFVGDQIDIAIGESLWVQSDSTDWIFNFPTVIK